MIQKSIYGGPDLLNPTKYDSFNNRFLRKRGMASTLKMEYQVFLCIFQKISAMATLGLKEIRKFFWEGSEKGLPSPLLCRQI